jgi:hypothetical protein
MTCLAHSYAETRSHPAEAPTKAADRSAADPAVITRWAFPIVP